jgi:hypothetical protein
MYMEHKKSFQIVVSIIAFAIAFGLYWVCRAYIPREVGMARVCLLFLSMGAFYGFDRLLTRLLPPLFERIAPRLDK